MICAATRSSIEAPNGSPRKLSSDLVERNMRDRPASETAPQVPLKLVSGHMDIFAVVASEDAKLFAGGREKTVGRDQELSVDRGSSDSYVDRPCEGSDRSSVGQVARTCTGVYFCCPGFNRLISMPSRVFSHGVAHTSSVVLGINS